MVLVYSPVREDDDVGPRPVSTVHRHEEMIQRALQRGVLIVEDGDGLHVETRLLHMPDLHQVRRGEDRVVDLEHLAVLRLFLEEVAVVADIDGGVCDYLLADGVDGRIGDLCKELFEVVEQRLPPVVQYGQGNIDPHGGGGLGPGPCHGEDGVAHVLIGIAEGLLKPGQGLP